MFLDTKSLCTLSSVCRQFYFWVEDPLLWKEKVEIEFFKPKQIMNTYLNLNTKGWKWLYRSKKITFSDRNEIKDGSVGCLCLEDGSREEGEWNQGNLIGYGLKVNENGRELLEGIYGFGGTLSGFGYRKWETGCTYQGEWMEGKMSGFGTFIWGKNCSHPKKAGNKYVGTLKDDFAKGNGTMYYSDGWKYVGEWGGKDERWGQGSLWNRNNELIYEGSWMMNRKWGVGKEYCLEHGYVYEGKWRWGKKDGKGVMTWTKNDLRFVGEWKKGRMRNGRFSYGGKKLSMDKFVSKVVNKYDNVEKLFVQ